MTTQAILQEQIQKLQCSVASDQKGDNNIELEIEIDRIARAILKAPLKPEDRREMRNALLSIRARLVHHIPVNGLKDSCLFLNLILTNVPPSALCPAYHKMCVPTISTYHMIGWNISSMRLDPKALKFVPKLVLENAGPLEGKEIDLFWTAVDGRFYQFDRSLNHSAHPWAHGHALPGPEKIPGPAGHEIPNPDSNVAFDVNMGLFPEIGLEKSEEPGAIAINTTSPMNVHVHARGDLEKVKSDNMLYSPDNAHFRATLGSPLAIDWSVMQESNRIAITKRVIIFNYAYPICQAFIDSIRQCNDLKTHLERLKSVSTEIKNTFSPLIEAFKNANPQAMQIFYELPLAFQYAIYREVWVSFDSPNGIHADFGRASFEKDETLDANYHCNNHQCAEAILRFSARLNHLLVESQFDLLCKSQSLVKGDNVLTMMKCAQLFYKDPKQALVAFGQLPEQEKEAIYFAFWELNQCPRIDNFSKDQFPRNSYDKKIKAQAVLLAASRQLHQFIEPPVVAQLDPVIEIKDENTQTPRNSEISTQEPAQGQKIIELIFDSAFQSLENSDKANCINQLLSSLGKEVRERIYSKIYTESQDPNKGGPSWGEIHVADNMEVLANAIEDIL
jgi:hypothetical protein